MATSTRPTHLDFLLDLQNQWIIGIITLFILSMLFGMSFGYEPDWPFTVGWVTCGVLALIFITQAFPDVWNFTFWLVGIYALSAVAMFSILVFSSQYGSVATVLGGLAELTGIGITFYLILHFKNIRDEVSGITKSGTIDDDLYIEERYVPLGLWSLSVMIFWLCSNLTIWGWYIWATADSSLAVYVTSEIILLFLGLYILWLPQTSFKWSAKVQETSTLARPLKSIVPGSIPKTILKRELVKIYECPICGHSLRTESRTCPKCNNEQHFYWCPRSEVFIKRCSYCHTTVSYNLTECPHCNRSLSAKATCTKCGTQNAIRDWRRK
ncbi:MAG: hypothetical protein JSV49_06650 [Thermoplasmata archaeon]|nr:MAG: hypothetical protein JSV49_06650 [Thermoplasmata archaeon]